MVNAGDALINRSVELIVLISSVVMIAFMITGGCGGNGSNSPPVVTGFPPECAGTFDVDLSCPAESLAGSTCLPYTCDITDNSTDPPEVINSFHIVFGRNCVDTDCFTLVCQDLMNGSVIVAEEASIIVESVSGIQVGEDVEGQVGYGLPKGTIFIGQEQFSVDCPVIVVP